MTRSKNIGKWIIFIAAVLILVMLAAGLPAYAAEVGVEDTTGDTEASITFTAGELKLLTAPTLDFGTHDITDTMQEYYAESTGSAIRISDLRGNGAGWDLVATLSAFQLEEGGGPTLQAASVHTTAPKVTAVNGTVGTPPSTPTEIELPADGTETAIWDAAKGAGMGVWDLEWSTAGTKLVVKPGTAQKGRSVATINWSLQSTP